MATSFCAVELEMLEIRSFVRGFHAYKDIWTPEKGERLNLIREPENIKDKYAVSILKDGLIVGYISVSQTFFGQRPCQQYSLDTAHLQKV